MADVRGGDAAAESRVVAVALAACCQIERFCHSAALLLHLPPSVSPACVCPGQRSAPLKGTQRSSNLSLTIANTTPIWAKPSLTIENDRVPWTWPRAYLTFGAPDFRNSGSNPDDPKTDVKREPYGSPTFNWLGQRESRVRFANALPLPRKLGRANS